jgi:aminoglycoside phosphotransferase (APT) family kinase protein
MADPKAANRFGKVLAQTMAKIHAIIPPRRDPEGADETAIEATRAYIEATRAFYRSRARETNPRIEAGFVFLLSKSPEEDGAVPSLVHGDIGFHNLMMENGDVTAVLDWDYSHTGDPAEDVNYCRPFVERILPWDDFLSEYYAYGGRPYTLEKDRYYSVWRDVRNAAACVGALGALFISKQGSIKLATAGLIYGPRFEMSTLSAIMAVNPEKPQGKAIDPQVNEHE